MSTDAERADRVHDEVLAGLLGHVAEPGSAREIEGVTVTFAALRARGLRIGVASVMPRAVVNALLISADWFDQGLVDTAVVAKDVSAPRPQPGMILEAMARSGVTDPRRVINVTSALACLLGDPTMGGAVQHVTRARTIFDATIEAHYAEVGAVREIEGVSMALRALRAQGLAIAVSTCLSRATAEVVLRCTTWSEQGLIDTTLACDDGADAARTSGDIVFEAMRRTAVVDVGGVIAVGGTPLALAEAMAAGCSVVVGATYGSHGRDELFVHPHTHLVDQVHEVLERRSV